MTLVAAGRVAVPFDPGAPAAEAARVLGVARPAASLIARGTTGDAARETGRADGTGENTGPFGIMEFDFDLDGLAAPGQGGGGGIFLCTSRAQGAGDAQGDPAARKAARARGRLRGRVRTGSAGPTAATPVPLFHVNAEVVGLLAALGPGRTWSSTAGSAGAGTGR